MNIKPYGAGKVLFVNDYKQMLLVRCRQGMICKRLQTNAFSAERTNGNTRMIYFLCNVVYVLKSEDNVSII